MALRAPLLAVALVAAAAPAADAAQITSTTFPASVQVVFNATAGEANDLTVTRSGATLVFTDAAAELTETSDVCTEDVAGDTVTCTDPPGSTFTSLVVNLGNQADRAVVKGAADLFLGATVNGGTGTDTLTGEGPAVTLNGEEDGDVLTGGPGDDTLNGGEADDTLAGGAGEDTLSGGLGTDTASGGAGQDTFNEGSGTGGGDVLRGDAGLDLANYTGYEFASGTPTSIPLTVSLDGQANDGTPGENDNAMVEDVALFNGPAFNPVTNTLTGDGEINQLSGSAQSDVIDGGGGNDVLAGNGGDDELRARDGFADRVSCGAGTDTARVDAFDQVASGCETADSAVTAYATEDAPPTIAFVAPGAGAQLPTSQPTAVTVTAADDKAVAKVELIDDGIVVGTATAPPFTISYQPRGGDVGSNLLAVRATDSSGQTGVAFRAVRVKRFTPRSVSASSRPARDPALPFRFVTTGRVALPAGDLVTREQGCSGTVSVQVKRGTRTISTRRVALRGDCSYSSTVVFRDARRTGRSGSLKLVARFLGNAVLAPRASPTRTVRVG